MMKKTLLSMGVAVALSAPISVMAAETITSGAINLGGATAGGAETTKAGSPATNGPSNSYNTALTGSVNLNLRDVGNNVNSNDVTNISQDGNVVHAQQADQAIATSDLDSTISGNMMIQDSLASGGAQAVLANLQLGKIKREQVNTISASYSGAAGVNLVSQNIGNMASIQQSTVVQSNFNIQ